MTVKEVGLEGNSTFCFLKLLLAETGSLVISLSALWWCLHQLGGPPRGRSHFAVVVLSAKLWAKNLPDLALPLAIGTHTPASNHGCTVMGWFTIWLFDCALWPKWLREVEPMEAVWWSPQTLFKWHLENKFTQLLNGLHDHSIQIFLWKYLEWNCTGQWERIPNQTVLDQRR